MNSNQEVALLKKRIEELEEINSKLKFLLEESGIDYRFVFETHQEQNTELDLNQGERIIFTEITEELAVRFFSMFWGRTDVYSKRYVNKTTGVTGYFPQCENFWSYSCPKRSRLKVKCADCNERKWRKLERYQIM